MKAPEAQSATPERQDTPDRYWALLWQRVILRLLLDLAAACAVLLITCGLGLILYAVAHTWWGLGFEVVAYSLTVLTAIYLLVILVSTLHRHWRVARSAPLASRKLVSTEPPRAASVNDVRPDSSAS